MNRILGVCIGVVAGFINVLLILCLLWAVVVITNGNLPFVNDSSLSGSYFYSFSPRIIRFCKMRRTGKEII